MADHAARGIIKAAAHVTQRIGHAHQITAKIAECHHIIERVRYRTHLASGVVSQAHLVIQRVIGGGQVPLLVIAEAGGMVQRISYAGQMVELRLIGESGGDGIGRAVQPRDLVSTPHVLITLIALWDVMICRTRFRSRSSAWGSGL